MTAEDIKQLMKWIADLKEVSNITESGALEDQLADCLKKDASAIGKAAEQQKNASFIELQKESFYDSLIHYGAEKKESIENYVTETQYTQFNKDAIDEIINQFYNPDLKIVVKANIQQEKVPVEDTTGQEEANDQPTSETVETTENNSVQENTEEETTTEEKEPGTDKEEREEVKYILFKGTSEIPVLDGTQLTVNIIDDILKPIQKNIANSYANVKNEWTSLSSGLNQFEIENYSDNEAKRELENSFNTNVSSIENAVGKKEEEYMEYAGKVEEASQDNLTAWQKSIKKANEATQSNIDKGLSGIKENREQINEINNALLTDITSALPYSRLGELENRRVYSFISSPVEYQNVSEDREVTITEQSKEKGSNRSLLFGMLIVVLLSGSFLIYRIIVRKHGSSIRDENPDLL